MYCKMCFNDAVMKYQDFNRVNEKLIHFELYCVVRVCGSCNYDRVINILQEGLAVKKNKIKGAGGVA